MARPCTLNGKVMGSMPLSLSAQVHVHVFIFNIALCKFKIYVRRVLSKKKIFDI